MRNVFDFDLSSNSSQFRISKDKTQSFRYYLVIAHLLLFTKKLILVSFIKDIQASILVVSWGSIPCLHLIRAKVCRPFKLKVVYNIPNMIIYSLRLNRKYPDVTVKRILTVKHVHARVYFYFWFRNV